MTGTHDSMRLGPQTGEVIDRRREVRFTWDGHPHRGHPGDTIVSALAADGIRVFSRSFKYHRRRGLLTGSYHDPGCTVQVGDEPNVRGAHRAVCDGMDVRPQHAWPSLRHDVKAVNQVAARFLTTGFYYKTFMAPRALWPVYARVLRRFSAGGTVPSTTPRATYDHRYAHVDVLVAGGGPAGIAAALGAADEGARVMLVDEEHDLGGHLRWGDAAVLERLGHLRDAVAATDIEVLTDAVVTGRYDGNWVAVLERAPAPVAERLVKVRAGTLVVAPGLIERPYVFAGNDLPGVMLSTAVQRLIRLYAVRPGRAAVVLTANADGDAAAADLEAAGVEVRAVVDARRGGDVIRAAGRGGLRAVELADGRTIPCDLLVTATGWTASTALLTMAGARPVYRPEAARFVADALPPGVAATGGIVGDGTIDEMLAHGRTTGRRAARRRRGAPPDGAGRPVAPPQGGPDPDAVSAPPVAPHPALFRGVTHGFVDFSEDVTSQDLYAAVAEGYDHIELAKRYTTATMGPLQGKLAVINTAAVVAAATGRSVGEIGTTVARPPYTPISLGALAGRIHEPVRRSPMHDWHMAHGAAPLVAGAWLRPDHYGDPMAETGTVRDAVGLIDVTPLGKLDLRGPDVSVLLNLLYVNRWSRLPIGSVRYGAMCADDGVVLDDGVTGRLDSEHYLMTTTSSGALTVWEWVEQWLQTERPDLGVHVTPVTTAYASMNLAGPRAREVLARVATDVDLAPEAFGHMRVRSATVAGVPDCIVWRIGFTGELSYELHVPSGYGLHVWTSLLEAGRDLGIRPFGVEAQRILRLEKGHAIVGQDTDGLTRAHSAGLGWAVKLEKDDFAGRPELAWQRQRGGHDRLVGLQPLDGAIVPAEASQIVDGDAGGTIVGRVTSSRMSPTLGRSVCLAHVAGHLAAPGTVVTVRLPDGRHVPARVTPTPAHVDPEGDRLRAAAAWEPTRTWHRAEPPVARPPVTPVGSTAMVGAWHVAVDRRRGVTVLSDHSPLRTVAVRGPRSMAADLGPHGRAVRHADGALVCGFGPGEWLVVAAPDADHVAARLRALAAHQPGLATVTDLTHGRALLRLTGDSAPAVLAKICPIDLHDSVTPDGTALRTQVASLVTDLVRDDRHGSRSYLLGCEWSSAQYLFDEVLAAGREFGIAIDAALQ